MITQEVLKTKKDMRIEWITNVLEHVSLGSLFGLDYHYRVQGKDDGCIIQLRVKLPCNETGAEELCWQGGEKRYVSNYAIKDEIVNSAFDLAKKFFEHELRELFTYKQKPIYYPHWKVDVLAGMFTKDTIAERT